MTRINLPFRPVSGGQEIVEQLVANEDAIASVVNGDLDAETNIKVAAPSAALTGAANSEGVASTLIRSDAQYIIRGVEQLSTEPTSDHFLGRVYYDTTDHQHKACADVSVPTYTPFTNLGPTEVPTHGSAHGQSGLDPLPDLGVGSDMLGRSIQSKNLGGNITDISSSALTTIFSTDQITLAGSQVVLIRGTMFVQNASGGPIRVTWQLRDTDNSNAFVTGSMGFPLEHSTMTAGVPITGLVQLATGTHTLQLQAGYQKGAGAGDTGVDVLQTTGSTNGITFTTTVSLVVG